VSQCHLRFFRRRRRRRCWQSKACPIRDVSSLTWWHFEAVTARVVTAAAAVAAAGAVTETTKKDTGSTCLFKVAVVSVPKASPCAVESMLQVPTDRDS
jgi:hypothetical protein